MHVALLCDALYVASCWVVMMHCNAVCQVVFFVCSEMHCFAMFIGEQCKNSAVDVLLP